MLASFTGGCSELGSLAVGPVAARPNGEQTSYGDELQLRFGAGSSDGEALSVLESQARLAITERASAVSVGLGPAHVRWLGPAALTARIAPQLGVAYFDRTLFASAGLHAGLGLGAVLQESERPLAWGPWWPELQAATPQFRSLVRRRTLLTLELTGSADAQARGAVLALGLLVGLAWSEEQYTSDIPLLPQVPPLFRRP